MPSLAKMAKEICHCYPMREPKPRPRRNCVPSMSLQRYICIFRYLNSIPTGGKPLLADPVVHSNITLDTPIQHVVATSSGAVSGNTTAIGRPWQDNLPSPLRNTKRFGNLLVLRARGSNHKTNKMTKLVFSQKRENLQIRFGQQSYGPKHEAHII